MAESPERKLPSLVADDLVDLAREVASRHVLEERSTDGRPYEGSNGLAVAYPYAILELLVEIRDSLAGDGGIPKILHVATEERRPILAPRLDESDLDVLGRRIRGVLESSALVDPGRAVRIGNAVDAVLVAFLREKGILA